MTIRALTGMHYESIEVEHAVADRMPDVLRTIADWLEDNGVDHGILSSISTQNHLDDYDKFVTTLVWAD